MAYGCCVGMAEVFRTDDNRIDEARFAPVRERLKDEGVTEANIEVVKACNCLCHVEGTHQVWC
jgi:hypothetical protein